MTCREGETIFQTRVENPSGLNRGVGQVTLDGKVLPGDEIPLLSDGRQHQVWVLMGSVAQGEARNTFPGLGGS